MGVERRREKKNKGGKWTCKTRIWRKKINEYFSLPNLTKAKNSRIYCLRDVTMRMKRTDSYATENCRQWYVQWYVLHTTVCSARFIKVIFFRSEKYWRLRFCRWKPQNFICQWKPLKVEERGRTRKDWGDWSRHKG